MNAIYQAGCECVFLDVNDYLQIDDDALSMKRMDAIVVTNLFGIHNDIDAIKKMP